MMKRITPLTSVVIAIIVFPATFSLYSIIYAAIYGVRTTVALMRYYWDGEIVLCPPRELAEDVQWAVGKWNQAIQYFSMRYMLLDAMKTRMRVSSEEDNSCNIFFEYYDLPRSRSPADKLCVSINLDPNDIVVAYVDFTSPPAFTIDGDVTTPVKAAKIHLWRGLNALERRAMIVHEIAALLGIGPPIYSRQPKYRSASDLWGSLHVTSADIYALFVKNRYAEKGSGIIELTTPWIIPYTIVEEDRFHTLIAFFTSIMAAITTYITSSRRWKNVG